MSDIVLEFEILVFGGSIAAYLMRLDRILTRLVTVIELCPYCPHRKGEIKHEI